MRLQAAADRAASKHTDDARNRGKAGALADATSRSGRRRRRETRDWRLAGRCRPRPGDLSRHGCGAAHRSSRTWSRVHAAERKQVLQPCDREARPADHAREIASSRAWVIATAQACFLVGARRHPPARALDLAAGVHSTGRGVPFAPASARLMRSCAGGRGGPWQPRSIARAPGGGVARKAIGQGREGDST